MTDEQFEGLIDRHIKPMFTGAEISWAAKPKKLTANHATLRNNQTILTRWPDLNLRQIALKRSQYFEQADARLIDNIIGNLVDSGLNADRPGFEDIIDPAIRRAIAQRVAPGRRSTIEVARLIRQFELWAQQTYEGRPITAAIGLDPRRHSRSRVRLTRHLQRSYGVVVASGLESFLTISSKGELVERISARGGNGKSLALAPLRFVPLANWAQKKRVALALTRNGEILIFKTGGLAFAKRRGTWRHFPHGPLASRAGLVNRFPSELTKAVLVTCLDVSFAKSGGGIGIVSRERVEDFVAAKIVGDKDLLSAHEDKTRFLSALVKGRKFQDLDRWLRMDLAAIDGSLILHRDGSILAIGAILKIKPGSRGGGRQSAAETMGRYGLGIKVSSDGEITGYWTAKPRQRKVDVRFTLG